MRTRPTPRRRNQPPAVLRRVKAELRTWVEALSTAKRLDDRHRGHLEAMRHLATVIDNAEHL